MKTVSTIFVLLLLSAFASAGLAQDKNKVKEIALTFDDAPKPTTAHFESTARTQELIRKLSELKVTGAMIFANACRPGDASLVIEQLKKYKNAGHVIANHTCTHPRLDDVGYEVFTQDAKKGDQLLKPLFGAQKFFRYPFLNEGKDQILRDQVRDWLAKNNYRHGAVSVDDDDYFFSYKINQAKEQGKKIDHDKVKALFIDHLVGAADFYDDLAVKTIGRSPKHVLLLHEVDATVLYIDSLVHELRNRGWKIISAEEAYSDPIYQEQPKNLYANNGIIAQLAMEKTGERIGYNHYDQLNVQLNQILGLKAETK